MRCGVPPRTQAIWQTWGGAIRRATKPDRDLGRSNEIGVSHRQRADACRDRPRACCDRSDRRRPRPSARDDRDADGAWCGHRNSRHGAHATRADKDRIVDGGHQGGTAARPRRILLVHGAARLQCSGVAIQSESLRAAALAAQIFTRPESPPAPQGAGWIGWGAMSRASSAR
jgi:hypothetical protein